MDARCRVTTGGGEVCVAIRSEDGDRAIWIPWRTAV